jgi:hypothetical protein
VAIFRQADNATIIASPGLPVISSYPFTAWVRMCSGEEIGWQPLLVSDHFWDHTILFSM